MLEYYYLDVQLILKDNSSVVLTPAYFQGSIESSLNSLFGEIGGQTELELIEFNYQQKRAILQIPKEFLKLVRPAITLIGEFQNIPCYFKVNETSPKLLKISSNN